MRIKNSCISFPCALLHVFKAISQSPEADKGAVWGSAPTTTSHAISLCAFWPVFSPDGLLSTASVSVLALSSVAPGVAAGLLSAVEKPRPPSPAPIGPRQQSLRQRQPANHRARQCRTADDGETRTENEPERVERVKGRR